MMKCVKTIFIISVISPALVSGHGRLIEPPSRSSMWRYGFNNPPNFNDHESYCGGFTRQWQINGGKCGVCGDPWDQMQPRENEGGGKYGRGTITRVYKQGEDFRVKIELTANHMGYFEFRLCPQNNPLVPASQSCLDRHLLEQSNGEGARYYPGDGNQVFDIRLKLPANLTCSQCVLQWRYVAANNWGVCSDGSGRVGCGPQEEFRACSDVSITDQAGHADNVPNTDVDMIDEVEDNSVDWNNTGEDNVSYPQYYPPVTASDDYYYGERTAVIILASVLTAVLLFGAVFLYYYKVKSLIKDISIPELPSVPDKYRISVDSIKSVSGLCKLDKLSSAKWPLSNISIPTKLPSFVSKSPRVRPEISAPIPIAPPRTRRGKSRCTSPEPVSGAVTRRSSTLSKPLDISSPTEVTINGVTVGQSGASVMGHTADHGPTPSSRGVIVQAPSAPGLNHGLPRIPDNLAPARTVWSAHPVLLNPDQPDSSIMSDIPPPLPECPPPEDSLVTVNIDHDNTDNNTEA